jgi:hypothetical protein
MTNPTVRIHNLETNEIIDCEMTEAELAQRQASKAKDEAESNAAALLKDKKAALLARLGITAEEATLLLS